MSNNKENETILYFYNQPEKLKRPVRRAKKNLNDNGLNKKTGGKYANDFLGHEEGSQSQSLAARLAEMTSTNSVTSMQSSTNQSRANHAGTVFTDTRLQALKFLTEDMIRELEETLFKFAESDSKPNLPGQIIYDWHSDWTDLTEKCTYKNFPLWQTKSGRESSQKKLKDKQNLSRLDDNGSQHGGNDSSMEIHRKDSRSSSLSRKSIHVKILQQSSKLTSISENKGSGNRLMASRVSLIKNTSPLGTQKSRLEIASRQVHNTSTSTGCMVNYQLSSRLYKEKGWTVLNVDVEDQLVDNERHILSCLRSSLRSM